MSTKQNGEPKVEPTNELITVDIEGWLDLLEAMERLEKNPDFKKVVLDGYLKEKVLDSVSLLAHPAIKKRGERSDVMEDLVAASNLAFYFEMIRNNGGAARQEFEDANAPV